MKNKVFGTVPVVLIGTNEKNTMYFFKYAEGEEFEAEVEYPSVFTPQFLVYDLKKVVPLTFVPEKYLLLRYLFENRECAIFTIPLSKGELAVYKSGSLDFLKSKHLLPTLNEIELVHKLVKQ